MIFDVTSAPNQYIYIANVPKLLTVLKLHD